MRYAPETVPLRERALDSLVLGALSGTTSDTPLRVGKISNNLSLGPNGPVVRAEVIQDSIARLIASERVSPTQLKTRHAYYLTKKGHADLARLISSSETLFEPVLQRLLVNTDHLLPAKIAKSVCQTFICECFARFGEAIARTVTGQVSGEYLVQSADVSAAFEAAIDGETLSVEARDSLEARCMGFLKSPDPDYVRLKFYLTQGYYFAQLLGLLGADFNPLADEAFAGSVFYLDTNVLVVGLLAADHGNQLFQELVRTSKRLGISLRVTRATINETRGVAADRVNQIKTIIEAVPAEIAISSRDQFTTCFLEARELDPTVTPEQFLQPFDNLNQIVQERWGIEVDERIEDEILCGLDFHNASVIMQDAAVRSRGWDKSERILRHDVSHFALVAHERKTIPKTWFLTRDRSLTLAASRLKEDSELPFCFSLLGLLQSLSPFMTTDGESSTLPDIFSQLLTEQVFPREQLFSTRELILLVEMNRDVLSTPQEQLIQALDYVKHTILQGEPYRPGDCPKVALGLRSFLASSSDERRKELEAQTIRLETRANRNRNAAKAERDLRKRVQTTVQSQSSQISELLEKNAGLQRQLIDQDEHNERRRLLYAVVGLAAGAFWWWSTAFIWKTLCFALPSLQRWQELGLVVLGVIGSIFFCLPALAYVRRRPWTESVKVSTMSAILLAALALSRWMCTAPLCQRVTQTIQFTIFISHLTNSNGCGICKTRFC
jgi:hypothetical protein